MTGRRGIIGLCLLCALAFSAFAVQSASAAEAGTTAFTCKKKAIEGGAGFSREHCKAEDAVSSGAKFEHVAITTKTNITGTNETTEKVFDEATLESVQLGIPFVIHAKEVNGTGTMENKLNGTEHYIHGTGTIVYKGLTVTPLETGCKVKTGEIKTKELTASSEGLAIGAGKQMHLKFKPATAGSTIFAEFELELCTPKELNGVYKVEGTLTTEPIDGATINVKSAKVTEQNTLTLRKQKAGLEGTLTVKAEGTALSATTVETP